MSAAVPPPVPAPVVMTALVPLVVRNTGAEALVVRAPAGDTVLQPTESFADEAIKPPAEV